MRIGRRRLDGGVRTVVVRGEEALTLPEGAPTPDDVVRDPAARDAVERAIAAAEVESLARVDLAAPLGRFNRDVLCTGWNYVDHFWESTGKRGGQDPDALPEHPTFFTRGPDSVTGPNDDIGWDPAISRCWDYEVELALVIGRAGRSIPEDRAFEHIAGYLVANDVSQRDVQRAHGGQWLKGKSMDATMPIGPWLTTADEVDPSDLALTLTRNGEVMQSASTREMAFGIPRLIAELSRGMTLRPGDLVLTGTPSGIGNAREPQVFLEPGDELVATVERLGSLRNRVVAADLSSYRTPTP